MQNNKREISILTDSRSSIQGEAKLTSIQALRTCAFIGIFLSHAGATINWPCLGVSVFFILSGFLLYRNHSNDQIDLSFKNRVKFSWSRIWKLYPLHIITMCLVATSEVFVKILSGFTLVDFLTTIGKIFLNVTLTQSWVPNSGINVSLNGVAWFLSSSLFLYFMFPRISKWIQSKGDIVLGLSCVAILLFEVIACIPWVIVVGENSPYYIWFMYCFPVFRLGDFFIGCCLSKWYFPRKEIIERRLTKIGATAIECATLMVSIFVLMWYRNGNGNGSALVKAIQNWTTVFIPIAAMWILIFAENKGLITQFIVNPFTIYIGNNSAYLFLIHYVITIWIYYGMSLLSLEPHGILKYVIILSEFFLSILLSMIYRVVVGSNRKKAKRFY